jgi:hypothetical protein
VVGSRRRRDERTDEQEKVPLGVAAYVGLLALIVVVKLHMKTAS